MTISLILFIACSTSIIHRHTTHAYHRTPCKSSSTRRQFQFENCYAPDLNPTLPLNRASFVMSHNSATGYLNIKKTPRNSTSDVSSYANGNGWKGTITTGLLALYGKTQVGTAYDQLNDGARALDLRPKLYTNGSIGFHHGDLIDVPLSSIDLRGFIENVKLWCADNPMELVLIFHSELVHELGYDSLSSQEYTETDDGYAYYYLGIAVMKKVYDKAGVPYYPCETLSGLTVSDAMSMADLSRFGGQGYLLAVDRHDMYASFCGKANWARNQLVACYSASGNAENQQSTSLNPQTFIQCTDRKMSGQYKLKALQAYVIASANNEPSDDANELGPPTDEYWYPFHQIQGFWQVDGTSVQLGLMHGSTLLEDNRLSRVNEEMVTMAYNGEFDSVSIFSLDNVALNGLALFSVLRNACGQSTINGDDDVPPCGKALTMPLMESSRPLPIVWHVMLCLVYGTLLFVVFVMFFQAFGLRDKGPQDHRLVCNGHLV
ncbi:hypothetical protein HJC23_013003 [Cyclotella cryptica]|uniref:PLC-like phosphodiesterase n=1 Tax=Cyclotella cryptica TaxID=29204 RepID=A0ABD3QFT6_9STRA|eukprot:CCRYP_005606-RA/>CCRYP_005606-RA protein AED:0.13 eAED:0.13 QI:0/-1/0/1/-1/1/1/0/489